MRAALPGDPAPPDEAALFEPGTGYARRSVTVTPPGGGPSITRAGHTLAVLHKQDGRWRLARDANLLSLVPKTGD